jgi:hypothetical protein
MRRLKNLSSAVISTALRFISRDSVDGGFNQQGALAVGNTCKAHALLRRAACTRFLTSRPECMVSSDEVLLVRSESCVGDGDVEGEA